MSVVRISVAGHSAAEDLLSKSDRLFRGAISSFCSMTSATRMDASRLDQLAMPLLPLVSDESRRYAAAALSRSFPGPQGLVRRLAEHEIAISAPILMGSPVLTDVDLIGLIGRHGLGHAVAISRRAGLNTNIASLIRALGVIDLPAASPAVAAPAANAPADPASPSAADAAPMAPQAVVATAGDHTLSAAFDDVVHAEPGEAENAARDRLRAMMLPAGERMPGRAHPAQRPALPPIDWDAARTATANLISTGMSGKAALFHTAVADAFDLDFALAAAIADDGDVKRLATALKAAALPSAEAFLICALAFPPRFVATKAIRDFIELYAGIDRERARRDVSAWRERAPRQVASRAGVEIANSIETPPSAAVHALRAS